jgi:hypothetical protein
VDENAAVKAKVGLEVEALEGEKVGMWKVGPGGPSRERASLAKEDD